MLNRLSTTERLLLVLAALFTGSQLATTSSELALLAVLGVVSLTPLVPGLVDAVLRALHLDPVRMWRPWSPDRHADFTPPGAPGVPGMVLARAPAQNLRTPA